MMGESRLQVRPKDGDSSLILSKARSGLVARGRRDAAMLANPGSSMASEPDNASTADGICNKCGQFQGLAFAGCVCSDCSDALDKQWAGSTATDWLLTFWDGGFVQEFVFLSTTYSQVKAYWASPEQSKMTSYFRGRQPTAEEIAKPGSLWGTYSDPRSADWDASKSSCRGSTIRPATPEEIAAYVMSRREWSITEEIAQMMDDICERLGIRESDQSYRVEQAAEEVTRKLRELGWLEELVRMKRENRDALCQIDGTILFEIVLRKATDGLPHAFP